MKVTVDTNVLVRAAVQDDPTQAKIAARLLERAEVIAVPLPVLCEYVWVLKTGYSYTRQDISRSIKLLINAANVKVNRPAVESGLAVFDAGGDFADGVIAFEGQWLGAKEFVSFDKKAVSIIQRTGHSARKLD